MKTKLSYLFILISFSLFSQVPELKKKNEDTWYGKATYYVIKNDNSVRHGSYYILSWSGKEKIVEGNYSYGKKTGLWKEMYYGFGKIGRKSIGEYNNDNRVGIWNFFNIKGDTSQIYDFTNNKLLFSNEYNTLKEYNVLSGQTIKKINLKYPPLYVGGFDVLVTNILQQIQKFKSNVEKGNKTFQINTKISITIDDSARITDISYSNPIGYGYEQEINKWLKSSENLWVEGKYENENIVSQIEVPIKMSFQY